MSSAMYVGPARIMIKPHVKLYVLPGANETVHWLGETVQVPEMNDWRGTTVAVESRSGTARPPDAKRRAERACVRCMVMWTGVLLTNLKMSVNEKAPG